MLRDDKYEPFLAFPGNRYSEEQNFTRKSLKNTVSSKKLPIEILLEEVKPLVIEKQRFEWESFSKYSSLFFRFRRMKLPTESAEAFVRLLNSIPQATSCRFQCTKSSC